MASFDPIRRPADHVTLPHATSNAPTSPNINSNTGNESTHLTTTQVTDGDQHNSPGVSESHGSNCPLSALPDGPILPPSSDKNGQSSDWFNSLITTRSKSSLTGPNAISLKSNNLPSGSGSSSKDNLNTESGTMPSSADCDSFGQQDSNSSPINAYNSSCPAPNNHNVLSDLSSFEGSSWSILAAQFKPTSDPPLNDSSSHSPTFASAPLTSACGSMKLKKDDIPIYGLCPARDQFFVTNCDHCGQVIKYQALAQHIELRHSGVTSNANSVLSNIETPPPSTRSDASSGSTSSLSNPLSTSDTDFCPITSGSAFNTGPGVSSFSRLTPSPGIESPQPLHSANSSILGSSNLPLATSLSSSQSNQTKAPESSHLAACGTNNSGSEGTSLLRASPSSLKLKLPSSNSRSSSPSISTSNTQTGKGKSDRKEKLLPCKDRQYDPDKHCGVKTDNMDKECTRSLTCKTHSLTLRRQVNGRAKSFDDLLEEHRRSKEEALRLAGKEVKLTKKQLKQKEQEAKKALLAQVKSEKDAATSAKAPSTCSTSSFIASPSPIGSTSSDTGDFSPKVPGKSKQSSSSLLLQSALSGSSPAASGSSSTSATKLSLQNNLNARLQKKREMELQQDANTTANTPAAGGFVKLNGAHLDSNSISPKPVISSNITLHVAHGTNSPLFSPSSTVSITSSTCSSSSSSSALLGPGKSNNSNIIITTSSTSTTSHAAQVRMTIDHSNRSAAPLIVKSSHLPSPSTAPIAVEGANNIIYLKHPPRPLAVNSFNCRHLILSNNSSSVDSSTSSTNSVHNNTPSLSNGQRLQVTESPPPPPPPLTPTSKITTATTTSSTSATNTVRYEASLITSPIFGRINDQMYAALRTVFQLDPKLSNPYCGVRSNFANAPLGNINNNNLSGNSAGVINSPGILSARTSKSNSTTPPLPFTSVPLSKLNTNTTPVTLINALTGTTATKVTLSPLPSNAKRSKGNLQNQPAFTPISQLTKQDFVQPQSLGQPVFNQLQQQHQQQQSQASSQQNPQPSSSILINSAPNLSHALFNRAVPNQPVKRKLTPLNQGPTFVTTTTASVNNNSLSPRLQLPLSDGSTLGPSGNSVTSLNNNASTNASSTNNNNNNNGNSNLNNTGSIASNNTNSPKVTRSLIGLNAPSLISLLESGISSNSSNNNNNCGGLVVSNTSFLASGNSVAGINSSISNNVNNSTSINNVSNVASSVAGLPFASSSSQCISQGNGLLTASLMSPAKKVKVANSTSPASGGGNASTSTGFTSALSTPTLESLLDAGIPGSNRPTSADPLTATATTGLPSLLISSRDLN